MLRAVLSPTPSRHIFPWEPLCTLTFLCFPPTLDRVPDGFFGYREVLCCINSFISCLPTSFRIIVEGRFAYARIIHRLSNYTVFRSVKHSHFTLLRLLRTVFSPCWICIPCQNYKNLQNVCASVTYLKIPGHPRHTEPT